jgi:hypothetical protein
LPSDRRVARAGVAVHISGFQIYMPTILMSLVYGGVLERHPRMRVVIGEGGIGWIPDILIAWTSSGRTSSETRGSACGRAGSTGGASVAPQDRLRERRQALRAHPGPTLGGHARQGPMTV